MKIVMLEPLGFSGICYYTRQLCDELSKYKSIEITLVTSKNYELEIDTANFKILPRLGGMNRSASRLSRGLNYFLSLKEVLKMIREQSPQIVHFQDSLLPEADLMLVKWIRKKKIPIIYTAHDVDRSSLRYTSNLRKTWNRAMTRRLYSLTDHVLVHSNAANKEIQEVFLLPAGKISQIPFGGNYQMHIRNAEIPSQKQARIELGIPHEHLVALFFGDRRISKGLDILIEASAETIRQIPRFTLLIAGESRVEHKVDYRALINRAGIQDHCVFIDQFIPTTRVPVYFAACDFLVLPYRKVYQSGVVLTAYSFGRPVVACRCPGLSEFVEEAKTGWLIDDCSPMSLAQQIVQLSNKKELLYEMGKHAKELSESQYSFTTIAKKHFDFYQTLIRRNPINGIA